VQLKENFVDPFIPFGPRELSQVARLAKEWESLFDGEEVLPKRFLEEAQMEESWLGRARYFVPISGRRMKILWSQGLIREDKDLMCYVVDSPYTDVGLQF